ncbi:hypothetical protein [Myxococcus xanthus]|uniref:hypothetical protein n=1 Tax=Myxococcus xanthus TaxID=34 RepID=UPI001F3787F1|nr:hypothetical protein [Myxococcus xanthus]
MPRRQWMALVVSGLVAGCAARPERYGFDSATSACRQNPAVCARMAGEETVLPGTRAMRVAASIGTAGDAALRLMKAEERDAIEDALARCAEDARSTVLLERFGGRNPTPEECREEAGRDAQGQQVTWAMKLGIEMHRMALDCARRELSKQRPGGFSVEPRYHRDPRTQTWETLSDKEVQALVQQGRGSELKGSLIPDVVIHAGSPNQALAVYDFKFPCLGDDPSKWRVYPRGHPHAGRTQKFMYELAVGARAFRIIPRWGVLP